MGLDALKPQFEKFNKMAKNDGFINKNDDNSSYIELIDPLKDKAVKNRIVEDEKIDFYEYLEATSYFSKKAIIPAKDNVIDYSIEQTLLTWEFAGETTFILIGLYAKAGNAVREKIINRIDENINGTKENKLYVLYFYKFARHFDHLQVDMKPVMRKLVPLISDQDMAIRNEAVEFYDIAYKDVPENIKMTMLHNMLPLFNEKDAKLRSSACSFYRNHYFEYDEATRERVDAKLLLLVNDPSEDTRRSMCSFWNDIYEKVNNNLKRMIRASIAKLLNDKDWDIRKSACCFFQAIYKMNSGPVKAEIIGLVYPLIKDKDENVRSEVCSFYQENYKYSTDLIKADMIKNVASLLGIREAQVSYFYSEAFMESPAFVQKYILKIAKQMLLSDSYDVSNNAFKIYQNYWKISNESTKTMIFETMLLLSDKKGWRIQSNLYQFLSEAYTDAPDKIKPRIINLIDQALINTDWSIVLLAVSFYSKQYLISNALEKKSIIDKIDNDKLNNTSAKIEFYKEIYETLSRDERVSVLNRINGYIVNEESGSIGGAFKFNLFAFNKGDNAIKQIILGNMRKSIQKYSISYSIIYDAISNFYIDAYKGSDEQVRIAILNEVRPYLAAKDLNIVTKCNEFLYYVYEESSIAIQGTICNDLLQPSYICSISEISNHCLDYYSMIYAESGADDQRILRRKVEALLSQKEANVLSNALYIYKGMYERANDQGKNEIRNNTLSLIIAKRNMFYSANGLEFLIIIYNDCNKDQKAMIQQYIKPPFDEKILSIYTALNYYKSIYSNSSSGIRAEIRQKLKSLMSTQGWYISSCLNIYDAIFASEPATVQAEIFEIVKDTIGVDSVKRVSVREFYGKIFNASNEVLKIKIIDEIYSLGVRDEYHGRTIEFYEQVYPDSNVNIKRTILKHIGEILNNSNSYYSAEEVLRTYGNIYGISDDQNKKSIREAVIFAASLFQKDISRITVFYTNDLMNDRSSNINELFLEIEKLMASKAPIERRIGCEVYKAIYSQLSSERKLLLIDKVMVILADYDFNVLTAASELVAMIHKDATDEIKAKIEASIDDLLTMNEDAKRIPAIEFYSSIYEGSSQGKRAVIRNKALSIIEKCEYISGNSMEDINTLLYKAFKLESNEARDQIIHNIGEYFDKEYDDSMINYKIKYYASIYPLCDLPHKKIINEIIYKKFGVNISYDYYVLEQYFNVLYENSNKEEKARMQAAMLPYVSSGDSIMLRDTLNFFKKTFQDCSPAMQKMIEVKLWPMLSYSYKNISEYAYDFLKYIYKNNKDIRDCKISDLIKPLLVSENINEQDVALRFISWVFQEAMDKKYVSVQKETINYIHKAFFILINREDAESRKMSIQYLNWIMENTDDQVKISVKKELIPTFKGLTVNSYPEKKEAIKMVFSGKEIFDEYRNTKSIVYYLLCMEPLKIKDITDDHDGFVLQGLNLLRTEKDLKIKMAIGFGLVNMFKGSDAEKNRSLCKRIIEFIEKYRDNEASLFLKSLLILNEWCIPEEFKDTVKGYASSVIPKEPPYSHMFRNGKKEINIVACYGEERFFDWWRNENIGLLGDKLKLISDGGKGKRVYKGQIIIEGENKNVIFNAYSNKSWEEYGKIFREGAYDPTIDILIYAGHATGLISTAFGIQKNKLNNEPKIIMISACSSIGYYPMIQALNPNFQFITTRAIAAVDDGAPILNALLDVIAKKGTWEDVRQKLNSGETQYKQSVPGNFYLPDEKKYLDVRDSDGDGSPDSTDPVFDFTPPDYIPKEPDNYDYREVVVMQPQAFPKTEIETLIRNNAFLQNFLQDKTTLVYSQISDSPFRNAGWYAPYARNEEFVSFETASQRNSDIPLIQVKFNVGYAHCSNEWLSVMAIAEINEYLSLKYELNEKIKKVVKKTGNDEEINMLEKKREFRIIAHYLASRYAGSPDKRDMLEKIWQKAVEKYDLPPVSLKSAILVVQSPEYILEPILHEDATKEDINAVANFFLKFKH